MDALQCTLVRADLGRQRQAERNRKVCVPTVFMSAGGPIGRVQVVLVAAVPVLAVVALAGLEQAVPVLIVVLPSASPCEYAEISEWWIIA